MNFSEAYDVVRLSLSTIGINIDAKHNKYDGLIVKVLKSSNTLEENRSTNQTHIAITGKQMDIFPYLRADGYLDSEVADQSLKKYFVGQIPINISQKNLKYLSGEDINDVTDEAFIETKTSVLRSSRSKQVEQLQLSLLDSDDINFIQFRRKLKVDSCLIILKHKKLLKYEAYAINANDVDTDLKRLNNQFYKTASNTLISIDKTFQVKESKEIYNDMRVKYGENILLYGVPGSGKSYRIEKDYCNDFNFMERVVFHPDYMNTDFVGQILPTIKGEGDEKEITYDFVEGPFTRILKKAFDDPSHYYYLIIEEINRGNAPAIFGEVFQLLDRKSDGESSYRITNYNVAKKVFQNKQKENENIEEQPIYLPSNLYILATMNTADQNVFTLDTAFQRRWNMKMIENDVSIASHASINILDTQVTWEKFNRIINEQIIISSSTVLSSEDKRLGAYFITEEILKHYTIDKNRHEIAKKYNLDTNNTTRISNVINDLNARFGDKVIKYLWDDAFKFNRSDLFDDQYSSLDKVLKGFNEFKGNKRFNIFNEEIRNHLTRIVNDKDSENE